MSLNEPDVDKNEGRTNLETEIDKSALPDYMEGKTKADWTDATRPFSTSEKEKGSSTDRVEVYNKNADKYDDDMITYKYSGPVKAAAAMHKYLQDREGVKILDVGGGTGAVAEELKKLGRYDHVEGLDPAEKMLEIGLEKKRYCIVHEKYFHENSGLEADFYDGITCSGAFVPGHLPSSSVNEMIRITKPGGFVVIVMRALHLTDEDIGRVPSVIQELSKIGRCSILEDYSYDGYHEVGMLVGRVWVLKKACS